MNDCIYMSAFKYFSTSLTLMSSFWNTFLILTLISETPQWEGWGEGAAFLELF